MENNIPRLLTLNEVGEFIDKIKKDKLEV